MTYQHIEFAGSKCQIHHPNQTSLRLNELVGWTWSWLCLVKKLVGLGGRVRGL